MLVEVWRDRRCGNQTVHDDVKQPNGAQPEAAREPAIRFWPGKNEPREEQPGPDQG
jgi:hypothetical protein